MDTTTTIFIVPEDNSGEITMKFFDNAACADIEDERKVFGSGSGGNSVFRLDIKHEGKIEIANVISISEYFETIQKELNDAIKEEDDNKIEFFNDAIETLQSLED